jgi:hypothetical protein
MGRKPGSRNRPKTETKTEKTNETNGSGHNSALTDDECRALTLHHKRIWLAADALVEKAKAERKAVADQAKADLGKGVLADIKDLILFDDDVKAKADIERRMRLAKWSGLPVGFQVDLFGDRQPADERHEAAGTTAGMAGENCSPPTHLGPADMQSWIRGWHSGQAVLAGAFGKLKTDAPVDAPAADTSEQPFNPPEDARDSIW